MSDGLTRLDQMINNLTSADRAWFVKFAMYMRIYGWVRDQAAVSNELMAMAQDLRDAEQDEQDAAGYFGHSPRTMAQAILRQLPLIDWGTRLKWFFALASVAWLLLLMFAAGRSAVMQLSIFKFFIVIACLGVGEVGVLALFAKVVYTQHPRWLAAGFASMMLICGCLAGAALRWGPNWLSLTLPAPWDFAVIGGSLVVIIGG